jgi:hypothetical protein
MRPKYNDAGERQQALARGARPIAKARGGRLLQFAIRQTEHFGKPKRFTTAEN